MRRTAIASVLHLLLAWAVFVASGCGGPQSGEQPGGGPDALPESVSAVRRAIEPPRGITTAGQSRAVIGSETRSVLGARPRVVLRWHEPVVLRGDLTTESELPAWLQTENALHVDAWVSLEDPGMQEGSPDELGGGAALRTLLRARPSVVVGAPHQSVSTTVPISDPEAQNGLRGLLSVVARPLAPSALDRWQTRAFEIGSGDRLVFGYGIEKEGWGEGWPPVRFRVTARLEGEPAAAERVLFERSLDPAVDARDRRWFDASLDLAALAGRRAGFVFEAEALAEVAGSGLFRSFPVVSNPEVVAGGLGQLAGGGPQGVSGGSPRRNLVLISLDTLRAQSVSAYGRQREITPLFDRRVVAEGAIVRSAVTPFPYTPPSHMSMLTGLDVCAHGVENRHGVLASDRITLAEALRAAGYRTAAFTENGYVVAGAGFARGFDTYHELLSEERAAPGFASETFGRAERWLASVDARPFFLFVHTYQVHGPYTPPRAYRGLFLDDLSADYSPENRQALDDYEREVRYTDELLGVFLEALDARGLTENTVVVVTSDHGEQFGEHFFTGHGFDVHDEALLVPLAIRAPGLVPPGLVVEEQIGLIDITPTLLDLLEVDPLPDVQGRSFAGLLVAAKRSDRPAFQERPLVSIASHSRSVRTRRYKYSEGTAKSAWHKLYHLEADPLEKVDVAARDPDSVAEARKQLAEHEATCRAWRRDHPAPQSITTQEQRPPGWMIHRDEIERKLRSLGYVE